MDSLGEAFKDGLALFSVDTRVESGLQGFIFWIEGTELRMSAFQLRVEARTFWKSSNARMPFWYGPIPEAAIERSYANRRCMALTPVSLPLQEDGLTCVALPPWRDSLASAL